MDESFDSTGQVKIKLQRNLRAVDKASDHLSGEAEFDAVAVSPPESVRKAKAVNLQEYLDQSLNDLKQQLNHYQNVCSRISAGEWKLIDVADYLHLLVKSLNFDAISLVLVDPDKPGEFMPMVSRGYHNPPAVELEQFWLPCIGKNGLEIKWDALLALAQRNNSPLAAWIEQEKIFRIGYSPVQDGKCITGFMIISSYKEKHLSPLASVLLELCGGHIGLALAARRSRNQSIQVGNVDSTNAKTTLLMLKSMFNQLSTAGSSASVAQLTEMIDRSKQLIDQALALDE